MNNVKKNWWNKDKQVPIDNKNFQKIINDLLFLCPSSTRHENKSESKEKIVYYLPVSARAKTFRDRKITGDLLRTILSNIKKDFNYNERYCVVDSKVSIDEKMNEVASRITLSDPNFEVIIMRKRNDMSDTESLYYYLRNSLAHGSFEYVPQDGRRDAYYLIECNYKDEIKAQMRLKEKTLLKLARLSNLSSKEIKDMQGRNKNKKKRNDMDKN